MTRLARLAYLLPVVCTAPMIVGCSSGTSTGPLPTGSRSSSGLVAAILYVQQWGQILWGMVSTQTGTTQPVVNPPAPGPNNTMVQTGTSADGTEWVLTIFLPPPPPPFPPPMPDPQAMLEITYPDGTTQTVTQSANDPTVPPPLIRTNWQVTTSEGLTVNYTSTLDPGPPFPPDMTDDIIDLDGASVLPNGLTQDFLVHTEAMQTAVHSEQSDGSTFTLDVPQALTVVSPGQPPFVPPTMGLYPDMSQPSTGTLTGLGYDIEFTLTATTGAPKRWARMTCDFGGGVTGELSLNPDFSGSGRLMEAGEVIAHISWTKRGETTVQFLTGDSSATAPAGAAEDFLTYRWETLTALQAPGA